MPFLFYRPAGFRESPLLRSWARDRAAHRRFRLPALRGARPRGARADRHPCPGSTGSPSTSCQGVQGRRVHGDPGGAPVWLPRDKDPRGTEAYAEDGIIQQACGSVKDTIRTCW